jgi:hypothetical protein
MWYRTLFNSLRPAITSPATGAGGASRFPSCRRSSQIGKCHMHRHVRRPKGQTGGNLRLGV